MKRIGITGAMTAVIAFLLFLILPSCVNEEYEITKGRINTEITVFQDGLSVPLGGTSKIWLKDIRDSLLANMEDSTYQKYVSEYFKVSEDGEWGVGISGGIDLSDTLNNLLAQIDIPDIEVSEKFSFNLNSVDVSNLKISADEYSYTEKIGGMITPPNFTFRGFGTNFPVSAGLHKYRPSDELLKLKFPSLDEDFVFAELPQDFSIPSYLISDIPVPVDPDGAGAILQGMSVSTGFGPEKCHLSFALTLPKGITSVEDIVLHEGAKVTMSVELRNSLFTSGTITPHLDLDIHEIFHLTDKENAGHDALTIDHILADFDLPAAGGKVSKSYEIQSLVLDADDWTFEEGCLTLHKEVDVVVLGGLGYSDVYTTTRHLAGLKNKNMDIHISLGFENFQVDDIRMAVEPVTLKVPKKTFAFNQNIPLPKEILSIERARFSEDSKISLSLLPENVPSGLTLGLQNLTFTFPEGIEVEGARNGVLSYDNVDITKGFVRDLRILGVTLPEPENGNINLDKEISVEAVVMAGGVVSSAALPADESKDLKVTVDVKANLTVADYAVSISGYDYPLPEFTKDFKFDVTGLEEFGTVMVKPQGSPVISVEVKMPQTDLQIVADPQKNLVITFPKMIEFKNLPAEYNYDKSAGTITFKGQIPTTISLPVDRLVIEPVKENGKYWAMGQFAVSGGIAIPSCTIDKDDVAALTAPDCVVGMVAKIPEIKLGTISMEDAYEKKIEKKLEVSMMSADELPEQLVSIDRVEFEDVFFNLSVDASKLPDLGSTKLSLEFEIGLPDMIVLDSDKVKDGNVLSVKGELDKDGKIVVDPIRIAALDLSEIDLKNLEGLKDTIAIDGKVRLEDVALEIDEWLGKSLEVAVDGGIKDIVISKVSGKVDVGVEPIKTTVDLTEIKDMLDDERFEIEGIANILPDIAVAADIKTNLGVPLGAKMSITPYLDGAPDTDGIWDEQLTLRHSQSAVDTSYTRYWISTLQEADDKSRPEGYNHLYFPLRKYLSNIPDSLSISIEAGTDPEQMCIIEPTHEYVVEASYSTHIPLAFGDTFSATYRDTIPELPAIVGQLLAMGDLVITGEITSSLPVEIDMKVNLLDSDGNKVPLDDKASSQKIKGCDSNGEPVVTELYLGLQKQEGAKFKDVSAIEVELNLSGIADVPLSDKSFIQLSLQALVPEGVTVDVNELNSKEE